MKRSAEPPDSPVRAPPSSVSSPRSSSITRRQRRRRQLRLLANERSLPHLFTRASSILRLGDTKTLVGNIQITFHSHAHGSLVEMDGRRRRHLVGHRYSRMSIPTSPLIYSPRRLQKKQQRRSLRGWAAEPFTHFTEPKRNIRLTSLTGGKLHPTASKVHVKVCSPGLLPSCTKGFWMAAEVGPDGTTQLYTSSKFIHRMFPPRR